MCTSHLEHLQRARSALQSKTAAATKKTSTPRRRLFKHVDLRLLPALQNGSCFIRSDKAVQSGVCKIIQELKRRYRAEYVLARPFLILNRADSLGRSQEFNMLVKKDRQAAWRVCCRAYVRASATYGGAGEDHSAARNVVAVRQCAQSFMPGLAERELARSRAQRQARREFETVLKSRGPSLNGQMTRLPQPAWGVLNCTSNLFSSGTTAH